MRKIITVILACLLYGVTVQAQTYNPNLHTPTNKPLGLSGIPADARSYFYDAANYTYRPYADTAEVLSYLPIYVRGGNFPIYVTNAGDSIDTWMFRDGTEDSDLVWISKAQVSLKVLADSLERVRADRPSVYTKDQTDAKLAAKTDTGTSYSKSAATARFILLTQRAVANGVAALGTDGKILNDEIPSIAITDTYIVGDTNAIKALPATRGDVAIDTSADNSYILSTDDPTMFSNWKQLVLPTNKLVQTVNGKPGPFVTLIPSDIGAQQAGDYALRSEVPDNNISLINGAKYIDSTTLKDSTAKVRTDIKNSTVTLTSDQTVTGNKTFTGFIYFQDAGLITNSFMEFGTPQFPTLTLSDVGGLTIGDHVTSNSYTLRASELTGDRIDTIPDKSGTFALTSDIATNDTGNVHTTTNQSIWGYKVFQDGGIGLHYNSSVLTPEHGIGLSALTGSILSISSSDIAAAAKLDFSGLSTSRTYTYPNVSGTLWTSGGDNTTTGNVTSSGKGTFSTLLINRSVTPVIEMKDAANASIFIQDANGRLDFNNINGTTTFTGGSPKIGIGVTTPTSTLTVNGDIDAYDNLGVGTSSLLSWNSSTYPALQIGPGAGVMGNGTGNLYMTSNIYYDGTNWRAAVSGTITPSYLRIAGGTLSYLTSPNTTPGSVVASQDVVFSVDNAGNSTQTGAAGIGTLSLLPWGSVDKSIQLGDGDGIMADATGYNLLHNAYYNGTSWIVAKANNIPPTRLQFDGGGNLNYYTSPNGNIGSTIALSKVFSVDVSGGATATSYSLSDLNTAPASSTAAGTKGEIRVTAAYIYVCTATNTWVRAALSTW